MPNVEADEEALSEIYQWMIAERLGVERETTSNADAEASGARQPAAWTGPSISRDVVVPAVSRVIETSRREDHKRMTALLDRFDLEASFAISRHRLGRGG